MKIAVIINTHNEGADLARTVKSYRDAKGEDVDLNFFIVADGTTDGSCEKLADEPDVVVLQPEDRLGCGQAKHLAVSVAQRDFDPDVIFHSDGHNRMIRGTLRQVGDLCLERDPCIVTPAVGPLGCAKAKTCEKHASRNCTVECAEIKDGVEPPRNSYHGGRISFRKDGQDVGLYADNTISWPKEPIFQTQVVNPSCFAYSRETLVALGGINRYPGWWGSQELGFSIRAWFAAVPIYGLRADTCSVLHRYRSWNHPKGKALAPYHIPETHRGVNMRYCHRIVFDEETWLEAWQPWLTRNHKNEDAEKMLADCTWLEEQIEAFRAVKKRTDAQFFTEVMGIPYPGESIHPNARRGLYCVSAGLGNVLLCVPAMKALSRVTGEPIDVWDRGMHQADGVAELLAMQPFVRKVITKWDQPDLQYYKHIVGSYWASTPSFPPKGAVVCEAHRGWRTRHEVECNMDALDGVFTGITPDARLQSWKRADFALPEDYVAVGVGCAGYTSKKWPHWEAFSRLLHDKGVPLVFLGTTKEDEPWMDIYGINLCGKTSIAQAAGILELARAYVGIDNGLSHMAAAVGTSSVLLYGPSSERKNRPWIDRCKVLRSRQCKHEPCWDRPQAEKCPYRAEDRRPCMEAIRPEYVAGEVLKELNASAWAAGDTWSLYLSRKQVLTNKNAEPLQNHHEFAELIEKLRHEQIVNVIEIGCADGGWLGILAGCIGRPLNILAIDPDPNSHPRPGDCPSDFPRKFGEVATMLREQGHSMDHLAMSSQLAEAIHAAQTWAERLGGVDLLHIDGDHSMKGCLEDWENYRGLVRPGGLVIFHDICNPEEPGVRSVFGAVQAKGDAECVWEIRGLGGSPKGRGIGMIRVPAGAFPASVVSASKREEAFIP